ncbi:hypothetical protein [Mucilaginibacter antarcticus]
MGNKDKISINVEINAAGQQQLNQYKTAFDGLRTSISNLAIPISKLDGDIKKLSDSISQNKAQSESMTDSVIKFGDTLGALQVIHKAVLKGMDLLKISGAALQASLTGGLSVIIAFLPEIINWVKEFSKGETTLSAFNKRLQDTKIVVDAVNQVRLQGTKSAQQELVHLELLYNATRNKNISDIERKKILEELKAQYPGYFEKMTTETMMNGQAAQSYNELTKSIIANSRARAAENVMVKNQERAIGNSTNITKLKAELVEYNKQLAEAQAAAETVKNSYYNGVSSASYKTQQLANKAGDFEKQRDATQKLINNLYTDSTLLNRQNDALAKNVAEDTQKYGAKILNVNPVISYKVDSGDGSGGRKNKPPKEDRTITHDSPFEEVKPDTSSIAKSMDAERQKSIEAQNNQILNHKITTQRAIDAVDIESAEKRAKAEDELTKSKIHAGDRFIDAALKNSKKDSAIFKTAF